MAPTLAKWLRPTPLLLVKDGQVIRKHLRQELITMEELMSQLREQGAAGPGEVERAYVEPGGSISVKKKT
jgi:uncharacterized membrane protein YcaP (DUF421 family)